VTTLQAILVAVLAVLSTGFATVAAIGILRMPDVYLRLHASAKAGTLGAIFAMLAFAVYAWEPSALVRGVLVIAFLFTTAPVVTLKIARLAYTEHEPREDEDCVDQIEECLDPETHEFHSPEAIAEEGPA
jgi:multicomponent Na+:H+ antiporter subunit G